MIIHKPQNTKKYNKESKAYFLDFINCGLIQAQKNWIHKKRFLEKYEIIYVTEGMLYLQIDKTSRVLSQNDLIIIPPYKTISGTKESKSETSFFWADFLTDNAENFGAITDLVHLNQPDEIKTLFEELRLLSDQKNISDYTKDSFLLLLFHRIKKSAEQKSNENMIITKFCIYIESNITKPLTTQMVADALKYNKDYLCRVVKKNYGISLIDYINKQKINLAKKLLSTSNYSIKEISNYLGYDDSNLFTKYFKYHEKISPLQYRNSNSN